ncbi:LacI family DNA-binding transcriptional regulator [Gracilibacillus caseinilyticus]|uniref:LacI family DNA-binding transcriptional regulator n=1 Tax=Gracilibacillus caseinilyticus TaxID=2932256 RepID=A0ABY4EYL5_9BACI|nr:LacI family DNA-binding transcriptional regulator [Gracilibacillus caseinilyticus]UOQ49055.1 LacI family DNA-binding transcriptional regulator [Gracilibacillus caseinilyticus]
MANIRDIAKMAGVSVTTVSRVINNHPYVTEEKRKAVQEVMNSVDYQVNRTAVNLSQGSSKLIGVVVPFAKHPYFGLLIEGITDQAAEHQYHVLLIQTKYNLEREQEALDMLKHKQIDGLIICSHKMDLSVIESYSRYGKIVVCENAAGNQNVDSVFVDHYQSFNNALNYLHQKNYQRIGYCIGRNSGSNSYFRHRAYQDFLEQHPQQSFVFDNYYYFEDGQTIVEEIIDLKSKPDALLVTSDVVAAGILTACNQAGIKVPDDLAIIGFDNQPIAKMMGLTSFEIPHTTMGMKLFQHVSNQSAAQHEQLPIKLIERNTV